MGLADSKEVIQLEKETKYSRKELRALLDEFNRKYPSGRVPLDEISVREEFRPYAASIKNIFDVDKDGTISVREFIVGLGHIEKGSPTEQLDFAFTVYDTDRSGFLEYRELEQLITVLYKIVGVRGVDPIAKTKEMMDIADANKDGKLTRDEFIKMVHELDPALAKAISSLKIRV